MTGFNKDWTLDLPAAAATSLWTLVKDNGLGQFVACTAGQAPDGIAKAIVDSTMITLTPLYVLGAEILMRGKIRALTVSKAVAQYATLYTDNAGLLTDQNTGYQVGYAREAATGNGSIIAVLLDPKWSAVLGVLAAPTLAATGKNAEFVLATLTIPANTLAVGDVIDIESLFVATGNSTDTTQVRIRLGGLTGTVVADTTAVASVSAATPGSIGASLVAEVLGVVATGKVDGGSPPGYFKAANAPISAGQVAIDTTVAITVVLTVIHGTNNVGNSIVVNQFTSKRLRAAA